MTFPTATKAMQTLVTTGIARVLTCQRNHRRIQLLSIFCLVLLHPSDQGFDHVS